MVIGRYPVAVCQSFCTSGFERKRKNSATPLYTLGVLPPITHSEAPPMMEFCGAPFTSAQYGRKCTDHLNLACRATRPEAPMERVAIAHLPLPNVPSPWLPRPT